MCHNARFNWVDTLPTVLLGLRTAVRLELDSSPAEYLYGTPIRVPGEFVTYKEFYPPDENFIIEFREHMRDLKPVPTLHKTNRTPFVFKDLSTCTHVWLRAENTRSLERPYIGPCKGIKRTSDSVFKIRFPDDHVNIERLKPAYTDNHDLDYPNTSLQLESLLKPTDNTDKPTQSSPVNDKPNYT